MKKPRLDLRGAAFVWSDDPYRIARASRMIVELKLSAIDRTLVILRRGNRF